jgi:hypothetical protein
MAELNSIDQKYRVGHTYRDRAGHSFDDDEFLRWLRSGGKTISNSGGIRFRDFLKQEIIDPETGRKVPAFFVLVTAEKHTQFHNPWDDIIDETGGEIIYWGDAKFKDRGRTFDRFPGNGRLLATNNIRLGQRTRLAPPILHFTKPATGLIRFTGLCSLAGADIAWFEDSGKPVKNVRFRLAILDTDQVSAEWLRHRAVAETPEDMDILAPDVWAHAKNGRILKRHVWAAQIRTRDQQQPPASSGDRKILDEIMSLTPAQFETFTVALIEKMPEIVPGLNHQVIQTRRSADHGVDFFGNFTLPYPISYDISFVGEAKRYKSAVTPDKVSRLVARLGRGQYGLFFTTSWYTEQAQREVILDRYPVRLFSGLDIINILRAGNCISGDALSEGWKNSILSAVDGPAATGLTPQIR